MVYRENGYETARVNVYLILVEKEEQLSDSLLDSLLNAAVRYRDRIDEPLFMPHVDWRRVHNERRRPAGQSLIPAGRATRPVPPAISSASRWDCRRP